MSFASCAEDTVLNWMNRTPGIRAAPSGLCQPHARFTDPGFHPGLASGRPCRGCIRFTTMRADAREPHIALSKDPNETYRAPGEGPIERRVIHVGRWARMGPLEVHRALNSRVVCGDQLCKQQAQAKAGTFLCLLPMFCPCPVCPDG